MLDIRKLNIRINFITYLFKEIHVIAGSRSHMSKETEEFINQKNKSTEMEVQFILKLCMVAEGFRFLPKVCPTMEWDTGLRRYL